MFPVYPADEPVESTPTAALDEPIPLEEGDPSGAAIIAITETGDADHPAVRGARDSVRRNCERVVVCLSLEERSGRVDHVECPVIDISASGVRLRYDKQVDTGATGHVSYRTLDQRPVRVAGTVRRCISLGDGRYELGVRFKRRLDRLEQRPAKSRPGRDVPIGLRPRKLRRCSTLPAENSAV